MELRHKLASILFLLLSAATILAAVGQWNGVSFSAWNGVAQTAWNGTSISCASGQSWPNDFTNDMEFHYTMNSNSWTATNTVLNYLNYQYTTTRMLDNAGGVYVSTGHSNGYGAARFTNSTAQWLNLPTYPFTDVSNYTITAWVRWNSGGGGGLGRIFNSASAASGFAHFWSMDNSTGQRYSVNGGNNQTLGPATLAVDTWYYVAFMISNGSTRLFTNNVQYAADTTTVNGSLTNFTIGNRHYDGQRSWHGDIQSVRGYSAAIGIARITQIGTNGPGYGAGP